MGIFWHKHFEWSVLQEMLALWTNSAIGDFTYFIGSFHLYRRHYDRAHQIVNGFGGRTLYEFGISSLPFITPFHAFDQLLTHWFCMETSIRGGFDASDDVNGFPDPFLGGCLAMLNIYNQHLQGVSNQEIARLVQKLPPSDFRVAAIEYFIREFNDPHFFLLDINEQAFFNHYRAGASVAKQTFSSIFTLLSTLHLKKTKVYKDAWKKRGKLLVYLRTSRESSTASKWRCWKEWMA